MTKNQQAASRGGRQPGTPGVLSLWVQRRMSARTNRKVRGGSSKLMGMDMLILNTVGRRSGHPRDTPVAWFDGADREQAWRRIAGAQPRIAKYQSKSDREYPVIRLTPR